MGNIVGQLKELQDRKNNVIRGQEELSLRATNFYYCCGFQLFLQDYQKSSNFYPELNIDDDFQLGEELVNSIVVKKIEPKLDYLY